MTEHDSTLLEKAKAGDRAAFRQLLEAQYGLIYRVAWRFTGHRQDAEDVAQEVCMALAAKIQGFRGDSSVTTWLYRVVVNACRDYQKKNISQRSLAQRYMELDQSLTAEQKEAEKKRAWLYRQIAALEEPLKETALLVLAEEMTHAEAGAVLNCAESTISWRLHEIRKQLKVAMDSYHD